MKLLAKFLLAIPLACSVLLCTNSKATAANDLKGTNVVLVHGAFADGSSWSKVIPLLQARGLHVVAVQNPLTSLEDDAAATKRIIDQQHGPVVLVGHSWGGVVITQAGNDPKVKALVYVAAFAPDSGQSIVDLLTGMPPMPSAAKVTKDSLDFQTLPVQVVREDFAQDLSVNETNLIAATQGPWALRCTTDKVGDAAWKSRPSWFVVSEKDHMISPDLQRKMATILGAHAIKVPASHAVLLSQPRIVADAIIAAASSAK